MLTLVFECQQAIRSLHHIAYLNIADPEHGIGGLESLLHIFIGASAGIQPAEVMHRSVNTTLAHVCIEGREPSQLGKLWTLILEVIASSESIDDDDRILALLHHLAKLAHDLLLDLRIVRAQSSWQRCLEPRCITLQVRHIDRNADINRPALLHHVGQAAVDLCGCGLRIQENSRVH